MLWKPGKCSSETFLSRVMCCSQKVLLETFQQRAMAHVCVSEGNEEELDARNTSASALRVVFTNMKIMGHSRTLHLILGESFSGVLASSLLDISRELRIEDAEVNRMRSVVLGVKNFIEGVGLGPRGNMKIAKIEVKLLRAIKKELLD